MADTVHSRNAVTTVSAMVSGLSVTLCTLLESHMKRRLNTHRTPSSTQMGG